MAEVTLKKVGKIYEDGYKAIQNIDLEIKDKEFVVFVGPSGSGKSTTLRMIAGLESISEGELYIGDTLVNNIPAKDRDIAMVFQSYALYPHMSVRDNIAFPMKMRGVSKQERYKKVDEIAQVLQLTQLLDRKPGALSGGQRQRVALGRAMVRNPKVFLLDEPLSNLDAKLRVTMRSEIVQLHRELQTTFIYVTHDQTEAMTMGDRIAVMDFGVVKQFDTPANLYHNPANVFVAEFIGSPMMNMLDGKLMSADGGVYFVTPEFKLLLPQAITNRLKVEVKGQAVKLGIRPENLYYSDQVSDLSVQAIVKNVEQLGSDTYVYFDLPSSSRECSARFSPPRNIQIGQEITMDIEIDKIHLFDASSDDSILEVKETEED